jgi:hypothetical protein
MYVNFWFEAEGIKLRDDIGVDNIMWESDFPHVASYYPHSWREVERVLKGVPEADRRKMQYENAVRLYKIDAVLREKISEWFEFRDESRKMRGRGGRRKKFLLNNPQL